MDDELLHNWSEVERVLDEVLDLDAQALAVSERTVKRDWRKAKALLFAALGPSS